MLSRDGSTAIVFNGEVYNFQELRQELEGVPFRSRTDTEVVLELYRRHGEGCFARLWGMFGLAIWDEQRQALLLARDRVGEEAPVPRRKREHLRFWVRTEVPARIPWGSTSNWILHRSMSTLVSGTSSTPHRVPPRPRSSGALPALESRADRGAPVLDAEPRHSLPE